MHGYDPEVLIQASVTLAWGRGRPGGSGGKLIAPWTTVILFHFGPGEFASISVLHDKQQHSSSEQDFTPPPQSYAYLHLEIQKRGRLLPSTGGTFWCLCQGLRVLTQNFNFDRSQLETLKES